MTKTLQALGLFYIVALLAALAGWVMNLIATLAMSIQIIDGADASAAFWVRLIGIPVPPLGVFLGWFG